MRLLEVSFKADEKMRQLSTLIVSALLQRTDESRQLRKAVFGVLKPDVFRDEIYVIYKVMYTFRDLGIVPDADFLSMYLEQHENLLYNAKDKINLNAYSELDDNTALGYIAGVVKEYARLSGLGVPAVEDFWLAVEKYKLCFQTTALDEVWSTARLIATDGATSGRKRLQGCEDAKTYVKVQTAEVDSMVMMDAGEGFIDAREAGLLDDEETMPESIGTFGAIKELNEYLGDITTRAFYSVLAPTKAGKSKFSTRLIHNIAVEHGNPVVVWPYEGGTRDWLAQIRSIHFDWLYNRAQKDVRKLMLGVSQQMIRDKKWKNENYRQLEAASRLDLFTNSSYGQIILIDRPFTIENFVDEIDSAVQMCGAKAVLLDYLQLIEWQGNKQKNEVISQAYKAMLRYSRTRNVAVISPAQVKQEFMQECSKSKDGSGEVRTAGGESAEVVRTPDVNIALYSSTDDLLNNRMRILSIPSRYMAAFPSFEIYCDLSRSYFSSIA